jgi:group II intron reverse transcriptase/maturase
MTGTPDPDSVSTKLQRIAQLAGEAPERVLHSISHHIDIKFLQEAYRCTRKDGAVGVDGQTAADYAEHLDENLSSLKERFKSGLYKAPSVRRGYVPKGDGKKQRPIGIPTFEDKVLQRAVLMVMEAVYEQDFFDCSYGFRPNRSAQQAIEALWQGLMKMGGGWVVEVDIESFFDSLDHHQLRGFLDQRVRDGVLRRPIHKWLKAGVLEEGNVRHPETGTPQGGVISPLLANIYLHEVLDKWFETVVKPRLVGRAVLIRYADDFVLVFSNETDARRVMAVLPKRFGKYGLRLHPTKTRTLRFCPKDRDDNRSKGSRSFDFLGFTHYWGLSRKGRWVVKRKTAADRFSRTLKRLSQWCREYRHWPVDWQHEKLSLKLRGHDAYFGISGNLLALRRLRFALERIWQKWLNRRGRKTGMDWERFQLLLKRYPLPHPVIFHSAQRLAANLCT